MIVDMPKEVNVEGTCTICGNKQTFYMWDDSPPLNDGNKITSKTGSPYFEKYCYKCGTMRVFTRN